MNFSITGWLKEELHPGVLVKSITSGFLLFILAMILAISFGALIFSGPLADYLHYGIGWIILGDAILVGTVALLSSLRSMIAVEQDAPSALIAAVALSVVASIPESANPATRLATVMITIVGASLVTGLLLILTGIFKLGGLVRFLPYPVIGGFLAGTGWTLVSGGVSFMTNTPATLDLLQPKVLSQWLPGLLLGGVILFTTNRFKSPLVLPSVLVVAATLFYAVAWLMQTPVAVLQAQGWLLDLMPGGNLWQFPLQGEILSQIDWQVVWRHLPVLLPLPLISMIAMLLNTSGIELLARKEINLSRELIVVGIANMLGGLAGGVIGYPAISLTALNHQVNGSKRLPGLIVAVLLAVSLFVGSSFLMYIPKLILGALIVYVGLAMLVDWVYQAWFKFPRIDFLIILSIMGIVIVSGFLQAVAVGLVLTIIMFVINYSRVEVIKHKATGATYRSRVTRHRAQQELLDAEGEKLYILRLHGFIFFGTANGLYEQVRQRIDQPGVPPVRFVLLDFIHVPGLDSTGLLSFTKMLQLTQNRGIILILTGLRGRVAAQFTKGGFKENPGTLQIFPDIDYGAEWCENQMLTQAHLETIPPQELHQQLEAIWNNPQRIHKLIGYMQRQEISQGEYLVRQGDNPDWMFLIESGQVTVQVETPGKPPMRLETMRGGRAVGELGFYLGSRRTAAVIADEPTVIYSITQAGLDEIEHKDPEAAYGFHRIIVHLMGERILHLIKVVNALND